MYAINVGTNDLLYLGDSVNMVLVLYIFKKKIQNKLSEIVIPSKTSIIKQVPARYLLYKHRDVNKNTF